MQVRTLPAIRLWQAVAVIAVALLLVSAAPTPGIEYSTEATEAAIEHVRREVAYVTSEAPELPREYVVALTVNSYVVGHISRPTYLYRLKEGLPEPHGVLEVELVEHALTEGSGICGAAALTALALYEALNVEARPIEAWYRDTTGLFVGHITTEVRYDGEWHWFDPSWGAFHQEGTEVYSLVEVVKMSPTRRTKTMVSNDSLLATQVWGRMDFTGYRPLMVVLDGQVVLDR